MYRLNKFKVNIKNEENKSIENRKFENLKENLFFLYKLIYLKSKGMANDAYYRHHKNFFLDCCGLERKKVKVCLTNIWELIGEDVKSPYTDFFCKDEEMKSIWRNYEINELGERNIFMNMERIKISHSIVLKNINILKLIKSKLIDSYFPLHENYQLGGFNKQPLFISKYFIT